MTPLLMSRSSWESVLKLGDRLTCTHTRYIGEQPHMSCDVTSHVMSYDVIQSCRVIHLQQPSLEITVQNDVKPKNLKEAARVVAGGNPRAAGLVGVDHLRVYTEQCLDDHILRGRGMR